MNLAWAAIVCIGVGLVMFPAWPLRISRYSIVGVGVLLIVLGMTALKMAP